MQIVLGNKAYSSWSMRPWLVLKAFDIPADETVIPLYRADSKEQLLQYSEAGKVPVLIDGQITVWDSLSIIEYLAEKFPEKPIWPRDRAARAHARSISAEMHSGFEAMRSVMSMTYVTRFAPRFRGDACHRDVARVCAIWEDARTRFGSEGPYLFGEFSAADAMYAPVCGRFYAYQPDLPDHARRYMETMLSHHAYLEWQEAGRREDWVIEGVGDDEVVIEDLRGTGRG